MEKGVAVLPGLDFMFMSFAQEFLSDRNIEKYTDNAKHLYAFCEVNGFSAENIKLDTSLAGYLLNPNSSDYSVSALSEVYGLEKVKVKANDDIFDIYEDEKEFIKSAAVIESLSLKLMSAITENSQEKLLYEIEIPLSRVLASMEREGFSVDKVGIVSYGEKLADIIINVVEKWASEPDAQNITVVLNSDVLSSLEQTVLAALKEKMINGVTLKANDNFDGGFRISAKDGSAYYDYSAESVVDMLSAYLSPKVTELLKKAE
jgi:vacuolar-type H+-ATPase subunit E/Vma4